MALPPLRIDPLEFNLASRPVQVLSDQARVALRDPPRLLGRRLGAKVNVGRLGVGHVERGKQLAHSRLLRERRRVDAAGSRLMALCVGVELLPLGFELLHLGDGVRGATLEVLLSLPSRSQWTATIL